MTTAACAVAACAPTYDTSRDPELYVQTPWDKEGENEARDALFAAFDRTHPTAQIRHSYVSDDKLVSTLTDAFGPAPKERIDSFLVSPGPPLFQWENDLEPIIPSAALQAALDRVPSPIYEGLHDQDRLYAVPIGVHRTNCLFYSAEARDAFEHGSPPATLEDLFRLAKALADKHANDPPGSNFSPFAIGVQDRWVAGLVLWENFLIAEAGVQFYSDYFQGKNAPDDPLVRKALCDLHRFLSLSNDDRDVLAWDQGVHKLAEGTAAMTIQGDWAKGYLHAQGASFDVMATPLSRCQSSTGDDPPHPVFVADTDAFALPRVAKNHRGAVDFLEFLGTNEAQKAYAPKKGSIPPWVFAEGLFDKSAYDELSRKTIDDYANPMIDKVPSAVSIDVATGFAGASSFSSAFEAALGEFIRPSNAGNRSLARLQSTLCAEYRQLPGSGTASCLLTQWPDCNDAEVDSCPDRPSASR